MPIKKISLLFALIMNSIICSGKELQCDAIEKNLLKKGVAERCYCAAADLKKIKIKLADGLRLVAACNLFDSSKARFVNLKKESVDMDNYDSNGNIPSGRFIIQGQIHSTGKLHFENFGERGGVNFIPRKSIVPSETAFSNKLSSIEVAYNLGYSPALIEMHIPSRLKNSYCIEADAELLINGLEIVSWGSEDDGARPLKLKALNVGSFAECPVSKR